MLILGLNHKVASPLQWSAWRVVEFTAATPE